MAGFSGDNGQATAAQLFLPYAVAVQFGFLYIADTGNNRIRRIAPSGVITTVVGTGDDSGLRFGGPGATTPISEPDGLAFDTAGTLYISEYGLDRVLKFDATGTVTPIAGNGATGETGDGGPALQAMLDGPGGLAIDQSGTVYVADQDGHRIRRIAGGNIISVAGTGSFGFSGDGGPALASQFDAPTGLALDSAGKLYVSDFNNQRIRRVDLLPAQITTIAGGQGKLGDGGPAQNALLFSPAGMNFDANGNLYVADTENNLVRKITPAGVISTVAGVGSRGFSGDGGPAVSAQLLAPRGVALDTAGNLYIADSGNQRIRRVNLVGTIQTIAGNGLRGFAGDGSGATLAKLNDPESIASDAQGNLYVADSGNNRVRRITIVGQISTFAGTSTPATLGDGGPAVMAGLLGPLGVALDSAGNLFIADTFHNRVRKVTPGGTITTVAGAGNIGFAGDGGSATLALLSLPDAVAVDSAGNLLIEDALNGRVRQVDQAGVIRTIAGNGGLGFSGDGGAALQAQVGFLNGIAVDAAGAVYISDEDNHRIRRIAVPALVPDFTFSATFDGTNIQFGVGSVNGFSGVVQVAIKGGQTITNITVGAGQVAKMNFAPPGATGPVIYTADSGGLHHEATVTIPPPAGPVISAMGVANAASFSGGPVAPGEIVTLYGSGLGGASLTTAALDANGRIATTLAGTTVTFDGRPAPLLYVSAGQLSAIVPYGVSGATSVQVSYNGRSSGAISVPVTPASPALFTANSSGSGPAAILNQDGSVNSALNPAARGSVVVLFGTGEGETSPAGTDGLFANGIYPKPVLPVGVAIDGQIAQVRFTRALRRAGGGVVPSQCGSAGRGRFGAVAISVQVGGQSSPRTGVTLFVQ